jgi:hypothetical protein
MLGLLCRAVTPQLSLTQAIDDWHAVKRRLSEPPRKRVLQRDRASEMLS